MAGTKANTVIATASYIEHMLGDLREMSLRADATFLSYLIEMAMIEASDIASGKIHPDNAGHPKSCDTEIQRLYMNDEI